MGRHAPRNFIAEPVVVGLLALFEGVPSFAADKPARMLKLVLFVQQWQQSRLTQRITLPDLGTDRGLVHRPNVHLTSCSMELDLVRTSAQQFQQHGA
jgi:hypothetical protein